MPIKMDNDTCRMVQYALHRIEKILATRVLLDPKHPLCQSAFTEILVHLNDLLFIADGIGNPIAFTDDVRIFANVKNITDAVKECRDAVCHIKDHGHFMSPDGSPRERGQQLSPGESYSQITFCVAIGKSAINQYATSEYEDDVAFFYGAHRLYLFRHITRLAKELKTLFAPYDPFRGMLGLLR